MIATGKIVVLAYPDTFVTMSKEWICKLLPLVGLGTQEYIKAGHAALVLIDDRSGKAQYFDFGRYITASGYGRVRSASTDAELEIPFKLNTVDGQLQNLDRLLLWLEAHPEKTHGAGRLLASVCDGIDHERALAYMLALQKRDEVPYGGFVKNGSNCSRFVADTILEATADPLIIKGLKFNKRFTPSTVGNVEKAASGTIYQVLDQQINPFASSAFRENLKNYFHRKPKNQEVAQEVEVPNAQRLDGIGCGAWFEWIGPVESASFYYRIKRYNDDGVLDYDGVYHSDRIDPNLPFTFTHQSHCGHCHIIQNGDKIRLEGAGSWARFNSSRKVRSA